MSITVAMQALVMSTSTPVAYAPPWASTFALKTQVTSRLIAGEEQDERADRPRPFRGHAVPRQVLREPGSTSPTIALAPANHRITMVLTS